MNIINDSSTPALPKKPTKSSQIDRRQDKDIVPRDDDQRKPSTPDERERLREQSMTEDEIEMQKKHSQGSDSADQVTGSKEEGGSMEDLLHTLEKVVPHKK